MTHNLIHTKGYLLVVDDSEIKEGDWCFLGETSLFNAKIGRVNKNVISDNGKNGLNFKKIIAHLPLNDSPILEGVDLLPLLPQHHEDNVKELAREYCQGVKKEIENQSQHIRIGILGGSEIGFIDGYNKAKEKYKYTEEDISVMVNNAVVFAESNTHLSVGEYARQFKDFYDKCIQSLDLPKIPIAFECEIKCFEEEYLKPLRQVSITTPKGHTQWVGKYIY
jgi:hypothetical protein